MELQSRSRGKPQRPETVSPLTVSNRTSQGLSGVRIHSEKAMHTAPSSSLEQAAESIQSWHVHEGWGLRAGTSWDSRVGNRDATEAVLAQSQY